MSALLMFSHFLTRGGHLEKEINKLAFLYEAIDLFYIWIHLHFGAEKLLDVIAAAIVPP